MCSNMEQIITLIGNVMEKLNRSCQENSKDTVGPSLELDSLNETVMKRRREPLSWNGPGGLTINLPKEDQHQILKTQRGLCQRQTDSEDIFEAGQQVNHKQLHQGRVQKQRLYNSFHWSTDSLAQVKKQRQPALTDCESLMFFFVFFFKKGTVKHGHRVQQETIQCFTKCSIHVKLVI